MSLCVGDIVEWSDAGKRCMKDDGRIGEVIKVREYNNTVLVLWEYLITPQSYHISFIKKVEYEKKINKIIS